jgi:cytochrome c-type biogenesis protein CcmH/NrfG
MSLYDIFWFLIGTMTGVVVMPVVRSLLPRRSEPAMHGPLRRYVLPAVCALLVAAAALSFYLWLGSPQHLQTAAQTAAHTASSDVAPVPTTRVAPLEESARKLALRLAKDGGSAADWRLLGQSYDFLGQAANAKDAYARAAAAGGAAGVTPGTVVQPVEPAAATAAPLAPAPPTAQPDAADRAALARAAKLREARNFKAALAIYAPLAAKGVMSADAWADYADVAGSLQGGKLAGMPATYIAQALRLDPRHPKALWLEASLAHEQARDADALATWQLLSQVLPADAPDQKIIAANIAEATRLARSESPAGTAPQAALARITGTVDIAAQFAGRAPQSATLFVYAKQADGSGPPLAVLRTRPGHWPVEFVLDDSLAMVPGRNLSGARSVELEARLSLSGNAMPQRGDFAGTVVGVDPRAGRPVHIAIDHEIG